MQHKIKHSFTTIFLILFSALFLWGCQDEEKEKTVTTRPVKTMVVGEKKTKALRYFPGKVIASKKAILAFQVDGELITLPILEGDQVQEGQLLAAIDPEKYENTVKEMRAKYLRNKANYERAKELIKGHFISRADYDAWKAAFSVAKANLGTARRDLRNTQLHAPFTGVIAKKYVDNHEFVKAKQPILELNNLTNIDIEIYVPESTMSNIKKGEAENVRVVFEAAPKKKYKLTFKEISTTADPETQTYRVVLILPSPKDIAILPGMTATVQAAIPDYKSGGDQYFLIPSSAIFSGNNHKTLVWVVDPKTMTVKRTPVRISRLAGKKIRVLDGISAGQRIVTAGVHFLKDGEKVTLLESLKQADTE